MREAGPVEAANAAREAGWALRSRAACTSAPCGYERRSVVRLHTRIGEHIRIKPTHNIRK
jgi:hypothetical protein